MSTDANTHASTGTSTGESTERNAAVRAYRRALGPGRCGDFDIGALDRTGVPVVSADHTDPAGRRHAACGYGAAPEQARTGAYGELAEEVLPARRLAVLPRRRASYAELVRERGRDRVADPVSLILPAGADYTDDRPLEWVPARRLRTGEEVLVPAEFAACDPGDLPGGPPPGGWLTTPVTNGLGAGDTRERALSHALLEILQRDGNATAHRAMDRGVVIEPDEVADPVTRRVLDRLWSAGVSVLPKLASTAFGMADVHVVGTDADPAAPPLALTACGEAAHPDRETALRKAVLEYASSRVRKIFFHGPLETAARVAPPGYLERELSAPVPAQEPRALAAMAAWAALDAPRLRALLEPVVLARRSTVPFSALPTVAAGALADPAALLADLLERLADFDVLVFEAGGPAAWAVKVLVPGTEVETMSYGRVGERGVRRLLERGSDLAGVGPPPGPGARPVHLRPEARERLGGPAWFDAAAARRVVGPLYPLYREPARHAVARLAAGGAR
ncbi:YcaO-like family protein [Streptomyces sp. TRM 70361]|uniref:YcaO-like family protein n=1 Tax=Streptomyces sp. TRM 70361 TaxID=3116553 RepID=UPI002E7B3A11|nr:YcaO-like family protein [Streptomyces sp. TRM 70361]MEE1941222.1 YcaO-like family protein [Streptomyces sp. TRM 70361]